MFTDDRHLLRTLLGFFDEFVDLFFVSNYCNHFFFHFFVSLAILLPDDYVVGILLYEAKYFLNDEVVDCIVFDPFSVLLKSLFFNILNFFKYFFINFPKLFFTHKFFEYKYLFFDEEGVKLLGHFYS
jgi:hypothetical protein